MLVARRDRRRVTRLGIAVGIGVQESEMAQSGPVSGGSKKKKTITMKLYS